MFCFINYIIVDISVKQCLKLFLVPQEVVLKERDSSRSNGNRRSLLNAGWWRKIYKRRRFWRQRFFFHKFATECGLLTPRDCLYCSKIVIHLAKFCTPSTYKWIQTYPFCYNYGTVTCHIINQRILLHMIILITKPIKVILDWITFKNTLLVNKPNSNFCVIHFLLGLLHRNKVISRKVII